MNDFTTADTLRRSARKLFANNGFRGSSVRAITRAAGVNLGAVTYHFGTKRALYEAVLDEAVSPLRETIRAVADRPGPALDRIEDAVRGMLQHLTDHPDLPRLLLQQLVAGDHLPEVIRQTMQHNIGRVVELIRRGQADGTIRSGNPVLLALSVGSQPIMLALMRHALQDALGLSQSDPRTRTEVIDNAVAFVRAGLEAAS